MSYVATKVSAESTTNANTAAQSAVQGNDSKPVPSISIDASKANVHAAADAEPSTVQPASKNNQITADFTPAVSVERSLDDDANIVAHDRAHYVAAFKRGVEKTARATLETCRVVYEASRILDTYQFQNFCHEVGYRDTSSSIRKFIAIGKVYPRFIQYADQLPSAWTAIYQITQIPADDFEAMLEEGIRLDELKGKKLAKLIKETRCVEDIMTPMPKDKETGGLVFAKAVATKKLDFVDWRALEKAMNEMQARLPVKFVLPSGLADFIEQHRMKRYEVAKGRFANQEFRPETWDMGQEANAVLPRAGAATNKS